MKLFYILFVLVALISSYGIPSAFAQFEAGGVDKPGTWYVGEGLKHGDYFRYSMCHVDYKECTNFEMEFWIKGDRQVGSETKWLAEAVVYDGSKVIVGELELGKIAPEPTGGSPELGVYRGAFKSSIAWLSAFATSDGSSGGKGPKAFSATSWGKIGNIGGEQVRPMALEKITVSAGTFDTVVIGWKTGGKTSKIWIVDDFPFPIKASTFTHVSEGIPPSEYKFELREYKANVKESPFKDVKSSDKILIDLGCQTQFEKVAVKKPTKNFDYQLHVFYGPKNPIQGCPMEFQINFLSKFDDTEFLNQVQFDFLAVDEKLTPLRSLAQEDNRLYLYSPSGQTVVDMIVEEEPGTAHYAIWVYGLAPEGLVPSSKSDYLILDIPVAASKGTPPPVQSIPSWIKNNAGWWADGQIDDGSFVQGIQWLIKEGIMKITS